MTAEKSPGKDDPFKERFFKHVPISEDLSMVVLKGHLLAEEIIDCLILRLAPNPEALKNLDITMHKKIQFLRVLSPFPRLAVLLDIAEKLNNARNKLAHHLEHPETNKDIEKFIEMMKTQDKLGIINQEKTFALQLRSSLIGLCASMTAIADVSLEVESLSLPSQEMREKLGIK